MKRALYLYLCGGLVAAACVVPDVEIVSSLGDVSGGSGGRAGSSSGGSGNGGENEGGDGSGATSPSGGTSAGRGGTTSGGATTAGTGSGGTSNAGTDSGGTSNAGSGGAFVFPEASPCASSPNAFQCDDFEGAVGTGADWSLPIDGLLEVITDAPSGEHVLHTDFKSYQLNQGNLPTPSKLSFWVRFPSLTDQLLVGFGGLAGAQRFGFGIESSVYRWQGSNMGGPVAPEALDLTREAPQASWTCVELQLDILNGAQRFRTSIIVAGGQRFELPSLDTEPTPEEDQLWNAIMPGWVANFPSFGDDGTSIEIDDVLLAPATDPSVCELFEAANSMARRR